MRERIENDMSWRSFYVECFSQDCGTPIKLYLEGSNEWMIQIYNKNLSSSIYQNNERNSLSWSSAVFRLFFLGNKIQQVNSYTRRWKHEEYKIIELWINEDVLKHNIFWKTKISAWDAWCRVNKYSIWAVEADGDLCRCNCRQNAAKLNSWMHFIIGFIYRKIHRVW